jgi:hypothetical protein
MTHSGRYDDKLVDGKGPISMKRLEFLQASVGSRLYASKFNEIVEDYE